MCVAELPGAKPVRISFLRNAETLHGFDESCLFEARNEIRSSGMFQLKDHFGAFAPNSFFPSRRSSAQTRPPKYYSILEIFQ